MIPMNLIDEIKKRNVVLFLGSGVSLGDGKQGMPSSFDFAKKINKSLLDNKKKVRGGNDLSQVAQEAIWNQNGSRYNLNLLISDTFNGSQQHPLNAHELLAKINLPMITTNYDTLIEKAFANSGKKLQKIVHDKQIPLATDSFLVKIHGCAEEPDTCIITEKDYYQYLYSDTELKKFVRTIFTKNRVIFIGYSISDINFRLLLLDLKTRLGINIANSYFLTPNPQKNSYEYKFLYHELNVIPLIGDINDLLQELYNIVESTKPCNYLEYYKDEYFNNIENTKVPLIDFAAEKIAESLENNNVIPLILDKNIVIHVHQKLSNHSYNITKKNGMVLVPKGNFIMGGNRSGNEVVHIQNIPYDYYIDETPVTNKQYKKFLAEYSSKQHKLCHENEPQNKNHCPYADYDYTKTLQYSEGNWIPDDYFTNTKYDDYPVVLVDWWDAYAFAKWAGKDLPTELEWEKAARGIDGRMYPFGNTVSTDNCSEYCNVLESNIKSPTPTHRYKKGISPYGCYDMSGNVWEWCDDDFTPGSPFSSKVLKGGSSTRNLVKASSSIRNCREPSERWICRGFRCVIRMRGDN